jgi:hypothetical protein
MHNSSLDTVRQLINGAIEKEDDAAINYRLRTASQLVDAIEHHEERLSETLENASFDDDIEADLHNMGTLSDTVTTTLIQPLVFSVA